MRTWKESELLSIAEKYSAKQIVLPEGNNFVIAGTRRDEQIHYQGVRISFGPLQENHVLVVKQDDTKQELEVEPS